MSEENKPRTLEDVQKDYQMQAAIAGQTQYQIYSLSKDLGKMNKKLKALNQEAVVIQQAEQAKKEESNGTEA